MHVSVSHPVAGVTCICIRNVLTRTISSIGGFDYSVCYLIDGTLMVDTGFPWCRKSLRRTLIDLGADQTIETVVNTHYHEDHVGNNSLLTELTGARIFAHPLAIPEIRFPPERPWYRSFLFGPVTASRAEPAPVTIQTRHFTFEVHHLPGHCPGHICLFEPRQRWLFSGDLYIAPDLDSQLADADGPQWIASLEKALALKPRCIFDAHGTQLMDETKAMSVLIQKRDFLVDLRRRILLAAEGAESVQEITRRVFDRRDWVNQLSFSDGWLSLMTGGDFSRGNLIKSFLREPAANGKTPANGETSGTAPELQSTAH